MGDFNFYEFLGIPEDATSDEIKRAYRDKARDGYHPDAGGSHEDFLWLTKIKDELLDPENRAAYDRYLARKRGQIPQEPDHRQALVPRPEPARPDPAPATAPQPEINTEWTKSLLCLAWLVITGQILCLLVIDGASFGHLLGAAFLWSVEAGLAWGAWFLFDWAVILICQARGRTPL
ncbi:MAG TPA: J domain-containing protein [Symbiobacteriaceae bacterium]|nr:J domain-containing protein [Symbiobacteriaceae bacterium]